MIVPITVLMPVFNGEKYIKEAIDSVLNQTYGNFELLIVNDGSTDKTEEIIKGYSDSRINLVNQLNGGVSAALNTGLKFAKGEFIARFDADDVCFANRLELQYNFMLNNTDYVLIGSNVDYITEEGEFIFTFEDPGYKNEDIKNNIMNFCPFVHSSVFYQKKAVIDLGGYDVRAHTFEDYFLWTKLVKKGMVANFKQSLIKVRFNASSVTVDEKDYDSVFLNLKEKALKTGIINKEDSEKIFKSISKLDKKKRESSYNRLLGKKYLWNNYQANKARKYILKSLKIEPFNFTGYFLLSISFLPEKIIKWIYNVNKS